MKNYTDFFHPHIKYCLGTLLLLASMHLSGQSLSTSGGTIASNSGTPQDYTIPSSMNGKYLHLTVTGADGGRVRASEAGLWKAPGQGATVELEVPIGSGNNEIPAGSTLRFIVGKRGDDRTVTTSIDEKSGGSGGGTGVAFKGPGSNTWILLAVAGGGTGSDCSSWGTGRNGKEGLGIRFIKPKAGEGTGGDKVEDDQCYTVASAGGGAFTDGKDAHAKQVGCEVDIEGGEAGWPNGPSAGTPTGGDGHGGGGWGFGGGGGSRDHAGNDTPGGGGGYSGGNKQEGGSSFLNVIYATGYSITNGANKSSDDGEVTYIFRSTSEYDLKTIELAHATNKCVTADLGSDFPNDINIQLWDCTTQGYKVRWEMKDAAIVLGHVQDKCLDVENGQTSNATNVRLWDCLDRKAQHWIYDGRTQQFRSMLNLDKCLNDAYGGRTDNGTNIMLWDCTDNGKASDQWTFEGAMAIGSRDVAKYILPVKDTDFAVHSHTGAESGSNIQLWTKDFANGAEKWYFDGMEIKMRGHENLCINLDGAGTSNGNNISLKNCNGTNAQKWIYDGRTKAIRSLVNPDKCMKVKDGVCENQSNIEIWNCTGAKAQQFMVVDNPCEQDITPPEARCKDVTYPSLTVPTANAIDDGSTDNCAISSKEIESVSGNKWKLILTDPAGNTSSCTATVTYN